MLSASAAAIAAMTSGNCIKVECWDVKVVNAGALYNGTTYRFSAGDFPVSIPGKFYQLGWAITRDQMTRKLGPEPQTMNLTIAPQWDFPGGQPTIAGGTLLAQASKGVLDGAIWTMYKGFFVPPLPGHQIDTTPGLVTYNQFVTEQVTAGRSAVDIELEEVTGLLDIQMPRNIVQAGCLHRLFDAGCTLLASDNTYTGTVSSVGSNSINSALTQPNGFFDQGVITFTSGPLNGLAFTVKQFIQAAGIIKTVMPWPTPPASGNTFKITPGCDKKMATCSSLKFKRGGVAVSNLQFFRGYPFTPSPETLYDGGTISNTPTPAGGQKGGSPGSPFGHVTNPKQQ